MSATAENRSEWRSKTNNAMQTCNPHLGEKKHDNRVVEEELDISVYIFGLRGSFDCLVSTRVGKC